MLERWVVACGVRLPRLVSQPRSPPPLTPISPTLCQHKPAQASRPPHAHTPSTCRQQASATRLDALIHRCSSHPPHTCTTRTHTHTQTPAQLALINSSISAAASRSASAAAAASPSSSACRMAAATSAPCAPPAWRVSGWVQGRGGLGEGGGERTGGRGHASQQRFTTPLARCLAHPHPHHPHNTTQRNAHHPMTRSRPTAQQRLGVKLGEKVSGEATRLRSAGSWGGGACEACACARAGGRGRGTTRVAARAAPSQPPLPPPTAAAACLPGWPANRAGASGRSSSKCSPQSCARCAWGCYWGGSRAVWWGDEGMFAAHGGVIGEAAGRWGAGAAGRGPGCGPWDAGAFVHARNTRPHPPDQAVDVHLARLPDAVAPVLRLGVHRRVPVWWGGWVGGWVWLGRGGRV